MSEPGIPRQMHDRTIGIKIMKARANIAMIDSVDQEYEEVLFEDEESVLSETLISNLYVAGSQNILLFDIGIA